jgi:hypothetical protein
MRANRVTSNENAEALSRRAIVAGIEREKEKGRLEADVKPKLVEQDALLLRDEAGVCWKLTIDAKGVLKTEAVKEVKDASPPAGK